MNRILAVLSDNPRNKTRAFISPHLEWSLGNAPAILVGVQDIRILKSKHFTDEESFPKQYLKLCMGTVSKILLLFLFGRGVGEEHQNNLRRLELVTEGAARKNPLGIDSSLVQISATI